MTLQHEEKATDIKMKTLKNRWKVKSIKEESEKCIIEDAFSLHTSCQNLPERDFSIGENHSNLSDKMWIEDFNANIKVGIYVIIVYEDKSFSGIITFKIDEVQVSIVE